LPSVIEDNAEALSIERWKLPEVMMSRTSFDRQSDQRRESGLFCLDAVYTAGRNQGCFGEQGLDSLNQDRLVLPDLQG
jgi:hypothetical protein